MTLSASLSNALSGLHAAARSAQVVSSNVANATTEGYARRSVDLAARTIGATGQGVTVAGISRHVDTALLQDQRLAMAASGFAEGRADAARAIADLLGEPGDPGALGARVTEFRDAIRLAASRPDDPLRLDAALRSSVRLTDAFAEASDGFQTLRERAEADIAARVDRLNSGLARVAELNAAILRSATSGRDTAGLLDERQRVVSSLSDILPLRPMPRENGTLALYTPSGMRLLDTTPARFEFVAAGTITADMTLASGALSTLSLDGRPLDLSDAEAALGAGSLAAAFLVRDTDAPTAQARLDALARDLLDRFAGPGPDPTLPAGAAGLFTDGGGDFDPLDAVGLAGRLTLNPALDPAAGGAAWRLRDGIAAATEGPPGDGTRLAAYVAALDAATLPAAAALGTTARGFGAHADAVVAGFAALLTEASAESAFRSGRRAALDEAMAAEGVDTDRELQNLLLIERQYAANARVIQTVDDLLAQLTRL